jgi:hypothetical protein
LILGCSTNGVFVGLALLTHVPALFMGARKWDDRPLKGKTYSDDARFGDFGDAPFLFPFRSGKR